MHSRMKSRSGLRPICSPICIERMEPTTIQQNLKENNGGIYMGLTEKSFLERWEEMGIISSDVKKKDISKGDLILRNTVIEVLSTDGGCEHCPKSIMDIPTVDAIPVDWFNYMMYSAACQGHINGVTALRWVLDYWKATKEIWNSEERNGGKQI